MLYLSEVLNSAVRDSSDRVIGKLKDVLIKPQSGVYDPLLFLLVERSRDKQPVYIPIDFVANLGRRITLKHLQNNIPEAAPAGEFVRLAADILDEQIVDVKGARIVRVNDLKLGDFENKMCVLGIDVSLPGILRRLGFVFADLFGILKINLIDWREAQLIKGAVKLNTVSDNLKRLHPADLANIIEELSIKQGSTIVDSLESTAAAQVVEEMDPEVQTRIMQYLGPEKASDIVESMSPDETVDLIQSLPEEDARKFLDKLQKSSKIKHLFQYEDDLAGGLMTTDYVEVGPEATMKNIVEEIRKQSSKLHSIIYVYVVSGEKDLLGVISLRNLILSKSIDRAKKIMKKVPENSVLNVNQPVEDIIRVMTKYNLYSAAVLDKNKKMAGVVTLDDVMRFIAPNA